MSTYTADHKWEFPRFTRNEYLQEIHEMRTMIEAGMLGWSSPEKKDDMFYSLSFTVNVQSWAIENGKSKPEDVDRLSKTQKQTIISSLAGYCVQEKWDILMGPLPDLLRETILEIFLETLIYKDIFGKMFMSPFWYLDGKMSPTDEGDEMFGARLQHLYDRFYESMYTTSRLKRCFIDHGLSFL